MSDAEWNSGEGGYADRRVHVKLRVVIDLATEELRRLGAAEEEIEAFIVRKRQQIARAGLTAASPQPA